MKYKNINTPLLALGSIMVLVVIVSTLHDVTALAVAWGVALLFGYPKHRQIFKALLPVVLMGGFILASYALFYAYRYDAWAPHIGSMALRMLAMSTWGFVAIYRIPLIVALRPFPTAQMLLTIAYGQYTLLTHQARQARRAWQSRNALSPSYFAQWRFFATLVLQVLDKALHQSHTVSQAMRSRGVFDA
ncbi:MAG: hypothetical protein KU37_10765 [Sulfuricurvum sp. PC08-66]|nr:MAG: hypothetical protein KU37_10765 [Sulfuricurvum sp. PC08-66]